jgi:uncharacterized membrane protein YhaH (DUF805 family)
MRYWDGAQWTSHTRPPQQVASTSPGGATRAESSVSDAVSVLPSAASGARRRSARRHGVTFREALSLASRRWADYRGRSSRSESWWVVLALVVVLVVVGVVLQHLFPEPITHVTRSRSVRQYMVSSQATLLVELLALPFLLPLSIRRLHDTGRSWIWLLVGFIPCVGWIVLTVFYCLDTQPDTNRWGPPPQ